MSGQKWGVLLIPPPEDPHGLVSEGVCGFRPPMAYLLRRPEGHWCCDPDERAMLHLPEKRALVLAWGGEPVDVGCWLAAGAAQIAPSAMPGCVRCLLDGNAYIPPILRNLGRVVFIDSKRFVMDKVFNG